MSGSVPVPCPRCHRAPVAVGVSNWTEAGFGPRGAARRSVWLDEPASCAAGCALTPEDVRGLLLRVFREDPAQLALALEEVPG